MGKKKRKSIPKDIESVLLAESNHTCNLCGDSDQVQIAHIDEDPSNNLRDNLIVLCLNCHSKIHQKGNMAKNYTPEELKLIRQRFQNEIKVENDSKPEKMKKQADLNDFFDEEDLDYKFLENDEKYNSILQNELTILLNPSTERKKLIEIRDKYSTSYTIKLKDFALYAIEFLLRKEGLIKDFLMLNALLNQSAIFRDFLPLHNKSEIISTFNSNYFKRQYEKRIIQTKQDQYKITHDEISNLFAELKLRDQYERKLEKERREKEQLISQIDIYLADSSKENLPPFNTQERKIEDRKVWFIELGLEMDPFPGFEGFSGFSDLSPELLEGIICYTSIFIKYRDIIVTNPETLKDKIHIILGSFGSGKTVLFYYLNRLIKLTQKNTLTLILPIGAEKDLTELEAIFFDELNHRLILYLNDKGIDVANKNEFTSRGRFNSLLRELLKLNINSIFLFIDDLHRPENLMEISLNFIGRLQIFKNQMIASGFSISIFISGIEKWKMLIDGNRSISGAIDDIRYIPISTEDNIEEMINKRFKAFAKNPIKSPKISREYIRSLYAMLKRQIPTGPNFREALKTLKSHLENYEFEFIVLSELTDTTTLYSIIKDLEEETQVKQKLDLLQKEFVSDVDVQKFKNASEVINEIYSKDYIDDKSEYFTKNKAYFIVFARLALIKQAKLKKKLIWHFQEEIKDFFDKIFTKYGLEPKQYLTKLFVDLGWKLDDERKDVMKIKELIKTISPIYGDKIIFYLEQAIKSYSEVFELFFEKTQKEINWREIIDKSSLSIENLLRAIICIGLNLNEYEQGDLFSIYELYDKSWFSEDILNKFFEGLTILKGSSGIKEDLCLEHINVYFGTFSDIRRQIYNYIKYNSVFKLDSTIIWDFDKKHLNLIRRNYSNNNYREALDKSFSFLNERIMFFLFNYYCLVFGNQNWRKFFDLCPKYEPNSINLQNYFNFVDKNFASLIKCLIKSKDKRLNEIKNAYFSTNNLEILNQIEIDSLINAYQNYDDLSSYSEKIYKFFEFLLKFTEEIDDIYNNVFTSKVPIFFNIGEFLPDTTVKIKELLELDEIFVDQILEYLNNYKKMTLDIRSIPNGVQFWKTVLSLQKIIFENQAYNFSVNNNGVLSVWKSNESQ